MNGMFVVSWRRGTQADGASDAQSIHTKGFWRFSCRWTFEKMSLRFPQHLTHLILTWKRTCSYQTHKNTSLTKGTWLLVHVFVSVSLLRSLKVRIIRNNQYMIPFHFKPLLRQTGPLRSLLQGDLQIIECVMAPPLLNAFLLEKVSTHEPKLLPEGIQKAILGSQTFSWDKYKYQIQNKKTWNMNILIR